MRAVVLTCSRAVVVQIDELGAQDRVLVATTRPDGGGMDTFRALQPMVRMVATVGESAGFAALYALGLADSHEPVGVEYQVCISDPCHAPRCASFGKRRWEQVWRPCRLCSTECRGLVPSAAGDHGHLRPPDFIEAANRLGQAVRRRPPPAAQEFH